MYDNPYTLRNAPLLSRVSECCYVSNDAGLLFGDGRKDLMTPGEQVGHARWQLGSVVTP